MSAEEANNADERIIQYKIASEAAAPDRTRIRTSKYAGGKYKCDNLECMKCYNPPKLKSNKIRFLCKIGIHDFHKIDSLTTLDYKCRFCDKKNDGP